MSTPISFISLSAGESVILQSNGRDTHHKVGGVSAGFANPHDIETDPIIGTDAAANDRIHLAHASGTHAFTEITTSSAAAGKDALYIHSRDSEIDISDVGLEFWGGIAWHGQTGRTGSTTLDLNAPTVQGFNCSAADLTVTLPDPATTGATGWPMPLGRLFLISKDDATAHTLTISPTGATIGGAASLVLTGKGSALIEYRLGDWFVHTNSATATAAAAKKIEWQLTGADANTTGFKYIDYQVPFDCTITGWEMAGPEDIAFTAAVNFWRADDVQYSHTFDASPLNSSPVGVTMGIRDDGDDTGFTTALHTGDWIRIEVSTADAGIQYLNVVLNLQVP